MCLGNAHLGEKLVYVLKVLEGTRMCGMRKQVKKSFICRRFVSGALVPSTFEGAAAACAQLLLSSAAAILLLLLLPGR